jgi:hypothetical protein
MLTPLCALLIAAAPAQNTLKLKAPATDALMLLARNASLNVLATPLSGTVEGEFPLQPKDALVRQVLEKLNVGPVVRREDFVFIGREAVSKGFPQANLKSEGRVGFLWEKEITAGQLALILSLSLRRPVLVAAPHDREVVTAVLTDVPADKALAGLAFFLGLPIQVTADGAVAIGDPTAAVTRDCTGFTLTEWTRLSGYYPGAYPFALLQTGGSSCPTETGRTVRTAEGELLQALGPDEPGVMIYRWVSGPKAGTFTRISFEGQTEVRACDDITRDSKLKRIADQRTFATLQQGLVECGVSRSTKAGEFDVIDIDAAGPYIRNTSPGAKNPVVQVTRRGIVAATPPLQTR